MNLIPKLHFLIHGASGLRGTELGVNVSRTEFSTQGIMFGGLMKGKLKEGLSKIDPEPLTRGVLTKANEWHRRAY